jgi:hypothetical protein
MKKLSETAAKIYLGKPCKNCGSPERYKSSRSCVDCTNQKSLSRPKEIINAISANHYQNNKNSIKEKQRRYRKANRHLCNAYWMKRKASKLQATPPWLTQEQLEEIKSVYLLARECELITGDNYHVDHIVPLQNKNVCGLHVPWNLQVLPADINMSKGNRYEET